MATVMDSHGGSQPVHDPVGDTGPGILCAQHVHYVEDVDLGGFPGALHTSLLKGCLHPASQVWVLP